MCKDPAYWFFRNSQGRVKKKLHRVLFDALKLLKMLILWITKVLI